MLLGEVGLGNARIVGLLPIDRKVRFALDSFVISFLSPALLALVSLSNVGINSSQPRFENWNPTVSCLPLDRNQSYSALKPLAQFGWQQIRILPMGVVNQDKCVDNFRVGKRAANVSLVFLVERWGEMKLVFLGNISFTNAFWPPTPEGFRRVSSRRDSESLIVAKDSLFLFSAQTRYHVPYVALHRLTFVA